MSHGSVDPNWTRLLALSVHELRTPLSVVLGYVRMLLTDRAGPLSEQQRKLLEEASRSCARLSAVIAEMSELSQLEEGKLGFNRKRVDLRALLADAVASLPQLPDREIRIAVQMGDGSAPIEGDAARLKTAFAAVVHALRRELVTADELRLHERTRRDGSHSASWIAIAPPDRIASVDNSPADALTTFNEWRGGCGLSLAVARRVINAHGGEIWSPRDDPKAGAVVRIPHA